MDSPKSQNQKKERKKYLKIFFLWGGSGGSKFCIYVSTSCVQVLEQEKTVSQDIAISIPCISEGIVEVY